MCTHSCPCSDPVCSIGWDRIRGLVRSVLTRGGLLPTGEVGDLTQQVLLALARRKQPFESPDDLRGLATVVARRAKAKWVRRAKIRVQLPWSDRYDELPGKPTGGEAAVDLLDDLGLMADDTREVLVAVAIDGHSLRAAAVRLGRSLHQVRRLYAEAVDFLGRLWGIPSNDEPPQSRAQ